MRLPPRDDAHQNGDTRIGDFNLSEYSLTVVGNNGPKNGGTSFRGGDDKHGLGACLQGGAHHLHHPHWLRLQGPSLHHHHPGKSENVNQSKTN